MRLSPALAKKIEDYTVKNFEMVYGNQSRACHELLEFSFLVKEKISEINFNDPNALNEIVQIVNAKKDNKGMLKVIDDCPLVQQKGIWEYLQMKFSGEIK